MPKTFEQLVKEHLEFTTTTFTKSTAAGALIHLKKEIKEVEEELPKDTFALAVEYADCLGCLLDSANRAGVPPMLLFDAFSYKLDVNKARKWAYGGDGSYYHVKQA